MASRSSAPTRSTESGWANLGGIALTYVLFGLLVFGLYSLIF
jgi:hypothetical protein